MHLAFINRHLLFATGRRSNQINDMEAAHVLAQMLVVYYLGVFDCENRNQSNELFASTLQMLPLSSQPSRQAKYTVRVENSRKTKSSPPSPIPGGMEVDGYENPWV
jgi:hypothetical protein